MFFKPADKATEVPAPLGGTVMVVVGVRSEEQMGRVLTSGSVTPMAHAEFPRVDSVSQEVGHSMCEKPVAVAEIKQPISDAVRIGLPQPAIIGTTLVYSRPITGKNMRGEFWERGKLSSSHAAS
jgi:hypothetical protein